MSTAAPVSRPSRRSASARIGLGERIGRRLGADAQARREIEEIERVLPRQVGDRAQHALLPEQRVGKARDVAHVDAAADDGAAGRDRAQRRRHQRADGGEDQRGVERLRRHLVRTAGPAAGDAAGEFLCRRVTRAREGEHALPVVPRHLRGDMRRRAEAVDAEPLRRRRPGAARGSRSARRRAAAPPRGRNSPAAAGSSSAHRQPCSRHSRHRSGSR